MKMCKTLVLDIRLNQSLRLGTVRDSLMDVEGSEGDGALLVGGVNCELSAIESRDITR